MIPDESSPAWLAGYGLHNNFTIYKTMVNVSMYTYTCISDNTILFHNVSRYVMEMLLSIIKYYMYTSCT